MPKHGIKLWWGVYQGLYRSLGWKQMNVFGSNIAAGEGFVFVALYDCRR